MCGYKAGAGPGDGSCISCQLEINIVTFAWCLQPQLLPPARPGWWLLTGLTQNIKNYGQTLSEAARGTTRSNWKVTRHDLACFWIHQCKCNNMILCCSVCSTSAFNLRIVSQWRNTASCRDPNTRISNNSLFQWSNMQTMHLRNTCNEWTIVKNFAVFLPTSTSPGLIIRLFRLYVQWQDDNHFDRTSEAENEWWSWDVRRLGWWDGFLVPVSPCVSIINGSVTPFYIHTLSSHRPYNIILDIWL